MLSEAVAQSGTTLPQVSSDGTGTITGTWRIVTSDGTANNANGDLFAVIDSTGTGAYSTGKQLVATSDMVGNGNGNVVQRSVTRVLRALGKRATNVGADAVSAPNCLSNDCSIQKLIESAAVLGQDPRWYHMYWKRRCERTEQLLPPEGYVLS